MKKPTCMRMIAIASPEGAREANGFGNIVARITTIAVIVGKLPPWILKKLVRKVEVLQIAKATARAVAICRTGSFFPDSDSELISSSAKVHSHCRCYCHLLNCQFLIQFLTPYLVQLKYLKTMNP